MVLPAVIKNGKRELKVNVMLDPCSTGSYVTEAAAEELQLNGEVHDLTISGTGGSRVKKQSKQVSLVVTSLNRNFSEKLRATIGEEHRRKSRSHFTRALTVQAKLSSQQFSDTTTNRHFWELEALGIKDADDRTLDEKEAVAKVTASVIYDKGRYSVVIPWKKEEPNLNNNYDMALRRLTSQEKALGRKGPEAVQAYNKIIED